jgi:hypothetical protein
MTSAIAARTAALVRQRGKRVIFRKTTSLIGPNPATNPVAGAISVALAAGTGAASVTLAAPPGTWLLLPGDSFTLAGDATLYCVTVPAVSASGRFSDVGIAPALASPVAAGAALAMTWGNDYPVKASIGRYAAQEVTGTTITAADVKVLVPAQSEDGRAVPPPMPLDRLMIDGVTRTIVTAAPRYTGDQVGVYEVQAR